MKEKNIIDSRKIEAMEIISELRASNKLDEIEITTGIEVVTKAAVKLFGSVKHISELKKNSISQKPGGENL